MLSSSEGTERSGATNLHGIPPKQSNMEVLSNDTTSLDPERAHKAAGDPGYTQRLESCLLCQAKALAIEARKEQEEK